MRLFSKRRVHSCTALRVFTVKKYVPPGTLARWGSGIVVVSHRFGMVHECPLRLLCSCRSAWRWASEWRTQWYWKS
jgi:hypothetical protein